MPDRQVGAARTKAYIVVTSMLPSDTGRRMTCLWTLPLFTALLDSVSKLFCQITAL